MNALEALQLARASQERILELESALERAKVSRDKALTECCETVGEERTVRELGLHANSVRAMVKRTMVNDPFRQWDW